MAVWVKFKDRDLSDAEVEEPTTLFISTLIKDMMSEGKIKGAKKSRFVIGCPSGWTNETRGSYKKLFENTGLKSVRIVPESRAALMTSLEQGYLNLDAARSSVLIVDIGSSTTDFTYCRDLDAEDVGHNFLGSGLLDTEIFNINLARQEKRRQIEMLIARYPHYRPIMEYWCRLVKEQYFNGEDAPVEMIKRLPIDGGVLFEIRMDAADAKAILETPLPTLNGFTWPDAFAYALRETVETLGGRDPETVLLTGGASRLPLVLPACEKAFPKARVVRGAEPEFAIARGLAWLGRFEHLHASFKASVDALMAETGPVYKKASAASAGLGEKLAPELVDALTEACIIPAFRDWRTGKMETLEEIEAVLAAKVKTWLASADAHGLTVAAPQVASLESDTALMGTTLSAVVIGVLLAKANLLAPLLANPIGLVVGGAVGGAGFLFGRKALEGKFRTSKVPVVARQLMTDNRIRKATDKQRDELIRAVTTAWNAAAAERFTNELTQTLSKALAERADDRAVLFMI